MLIMLHRPEEPLRTHARTPVGRVGLRGASSTLKASASKYSSLFPAGGIQWLCSGQTKARPAPGISQPSFEGRSFFCAQHQQIPSPSPPPRHCHPPAQSNPLWQRVAPRLFCVSFVQLSAAHTPTVPQAFLFTLAQMCAFTFGYFLFYFSTSHHHGTLGDSGLVER